MKVENEKVINVSYKLFVKDENGQEEMWEQTPEKHPLTYCHGIGMMLPAFEAALEGKAEGESFDFTLDATHAYGEYDERGVMTLDKKMFYNGDGEFDSERVQVGLIVPMNTADGQIVNAQVAEITDTTVTIDLNHPLAGEDLHFVGSIVSIREASPKELDALRNPHHCGHCKGHCGEGCDGDCNGGCSGSGECDGGCQKDC